MLAAADMIRTQHLAPALNLALALAVPAVAHADTITTRTFTSGKLHRR